MLKLSEKTINRKDRLTSLSLGIGFFVNEKREEVKSETLNKLYLHPWIFSLIIAILLSAICTFTLFRLIPHTARIAAGSIKKTYINQARMLGISSYEYNGQVAGVNEGLGLE